jgi:hypothetical protein
MFCVIDSASSCWREGSVECSGLVLVPAVANLNEDMIFDEMALAFERGRLLSGGASHSRLFHDTGTNAELFRK